MPMITYTGAGSVLKHGEAFRQNVPIIVSEAVADALNGVANFTITSTQAHIAALRGKHGTVLSAADITAHVVQTY